MSESDRRPWEHDLEKDKGWEELGPLGQDERIIEISREAFKDAMASESALLFYLEGVLGDSFDSRAVSLGPKDWRPGNKREKFGYYEVSLVMDRLKADPYAFQGLADLVNQVIEATISDAVLPNDDDIGFAFDKAKDEVEEELRIGSVWDPIRDRARWNSVEKILANLLLKMSLRFKGHKIVFDASKSDVVKALEKAVYADPENLSERDMDDGLHEEFREIMDAVVGNFWRILKKDVSEFNIDARSNWKKWWHAILKDESMVQAAKNDLINYMRNPENT